MINKTLKQFNTNNYKLDSAKVYYTPDDVSKYYFSSVGSQLISGFNDLQNKFAAKLTSVNTKTSTLPATIREDTNYGE